MTETKISGLQLAAYLMALDHPLLRVEGDQKREVFVYGAPTEIAMQYYQGTNGISGQKLFEAYRDLKGIVMQSYRSQD